MINTLTELASKKLAEARARAHISIEHWHKAFENVKELEQLAECNIPLAESLVAKVSLASQSLKSADYLEALEIEQRPVQGRKEIFNIARSRLEQERQTRSGIESKWQEEINQAKRSIHVHEAQCRLRVADKMAKYYSAKFKNNKSTGNKLDDGEAELLGFRLTGAAWPACLVAGVILQGMGVNTDSILPLSS